MSKYLYGPTVRINVSADFSIVATLTTNGNIYRKPFKAGHGVDGFKRLIKEIKKAEKEFSMKTVTFIESTGVYHLFLFHFLIEHKLEVLLLIL